MEINAFTIYLIGNASGFKSALTTIGLIVAVIFPLFVAFNLDIGSDFKELYNKSKRFIISGCIMLLLALAMPSSQTVAAMYLIPSIVNNEKVANIGENTLNILQKLTEKWLKDIEIVPKKQDKGGAL